MDKLNCLWVPIVVGIAELGCLGEIDNKLIQCVAPEIEKGAAKTKTTLLGAMTITGNGILEKNAEIEKCYDEVLEILDPHLDDLDVAVGMIGTDANIQRVMDNLDMLEADLSDLECESKRLNIEFKQASQQYLQARDIRRENKNTAKAETHKKFFAAYNKKALVAEDVVVDDAATISGETGKILSFKREQRESLMESVPKGDETSREEKLINMIKARALQKSRLGGSLQGQGAMQSQTLLPPSYNSITDPLITRTENNNNNNNKNARGKIAMDIYNMHNNE